LQIPKPQRGIKEEDNQVKFGTQLNEALLPVAIAPTNLQSEITLKVNDY
jgi:hypothetical protein